MVMKIEASTLEGINPSELIARATPPLAINKGLSTLAVIGASLPDRKSGFFILSGQPGDAVGDHELLDPRCAAVVRQ